MDIGRFGFGQPVRRTEDPRLLTGRGTYVDDVNLPGQGYACFLRSPHAHADIRGIDTAAARAAPGVLGIFTAADVAAAGLGTIPCLATPKPVAGTAIVTPPYPLLAGERVRHVGDAVALVVAATLAKARDAAELIEVDYAPRPAAARLGDALAPSAPAVWDEAADNVCYRTVLGDPGAVEAAFAAADHVTRVELVNNRVASNSLEGRGAVAMWDTTDDRYVLYTTMQGPHGLRRQLAQRILNIPENSLRVVCNDVGGAFGIKGRTMYREYGLVLWAAREVGRPVKWVADRTESFLGDYHGRDHLSVAELALDRAGNFLALRVSTFAAMGAYLSNVGPSVPASSSAMVVGTYRTPAIAVTVTGVFTNANPTSAYRGAGRPEACYVIERVVDTAAREMGIDPAELRRRNLITPEAMPYRLPLGGAYDSGEFARNLDQALATADWTGFETRRAAARAQGNLRGIGISSYVERCAGMGDERVELHFDPSGSLSLVVGSMSNGQGHETTFAQMVAAAFGLPIESIRYVQGDTDKVYYGVGTGGSRTALLAGTSVMNGIEKVVARGRRIAAHMMEAAEADVEFAAGRFTVAGTDRSVTITEVARTAWQANRLPPGMEPGLREAGTFAPSAPTYPNGCHVCEVEIDPATGQTRIVGYTVVDDVGHVINPLLLEGQIHGGIAQGVGQALMEEVRYDPESGQLLTASFMDYCMPRADDLCDFSTAYHEVPCRTNPLGIKGAGEAGTIGALPAVINAVIDALWPIGVRSIDMPATPEAVWRAIRSAEVVNGQ